MARTTVEVAGDAFRRGTLPEICVATGVRADGLVPVRLTWTPAWTWLLLPFGVVPWIIAALVTTESLRGELPVQQIVMDRYHRRRRAAWGLAVAGAVAGALAAASSSVATGMLGMLLLVVAGLVVAAAEFGFVAARSASHGDAVILRRVHPRFAAAVHEAASG